MIKMPIIIFYLKTIHASIYIYFARIITHIYLL